MNVRLESIQRILLEALEISDLAQREAFLSEACGGDDALRKEVEELIEAQSASRQFLPETPATRAAQPARRLVAGTFESLIGAFEVALTETSGERIGCYRLKERIGEGGCGVVYRAEQEERMRRAVALKIIKLGMDTRRVLARFEAERQALALMDHPNIAKVFDAGATETGRPYSVMELVRGARITEYCDENELSIFERLELFIQVCQAVQHA